MCCFEVIEPFHLTAPNLLPLKSYFFQTTQTRIVVIDMFLFLLEAIKRNPIMAIIITNALMICFLSQQ